MENFIVPDVGFVPYIIEDSKDQTLTNFFEELVLSNRIDSIRQCRCINTKQEDIDSVESGEYIPLEVSGGGFFTKWYYFYSTEKTHTLIFETIDKNDEATYYYRVINNRPKETIFYKE